LADVAVSYREGFSGGAALPMSLSLVERNRASTGPRGVGVTDPNHANQHVDPREFGSQVAIAERKFQRVLLTWAGDMLELRRRGLERPRWNCAKPAHFASQTDTSQASPSNLPMNDAA
jgi:hypothetical protein